MFWSRCANFNAIFARSQRRPHNQIKWIIAEIYDGIHTYAYIYVIQYNSFESKFQTGFLFIYLFIFHSKVCQLQRVTIIIIDRLQ